MFSKIYLIIFFLLYSCSSINISENKKIKFNDILNYYIKLTDRDNEYIGISSIVDFDNSNEYLIMITISRRESCEIGSYRNDNVYLKNNVLIVLVKNNVLNNTFFNFNKKFKKEVCFKETNNVDSNNYAGREILILRFDKSYNFLNVYSPYYDENYIDREKTDNLLKSLSK